MELTTLTRTLLFDTYGDMLTDKQRLCFDLRYNQDYSLGEIGELEGISRQGVRDTIVRAEATLQELEEKIGAVRRQLQMDEAREALLNAMQEAQALGEKGKAVTEKISVALDHMKE